MCTATICKDDLKLQLLGSGGSTAEADCLVYIIDMEKDEADPSFEIMENLSAYGVKEVIIAGYYVSSATKNEAEDSTTVSDR